MNERILNLQNLYGKLAKLPGGVQRLLKQVIYQESLMEASFVRENYLTGGTTPNKLAVRSGLLRRSFKAAQATVQGDRVTGGIKGGTAYAWTHIGRKGSIVTIRPKTAKALAVPVGKAKTSAGVGKGGPRSGRFGPLQFIPASNFRTKPKPNVVGILVGKTIAQKGKYAGQARGKAGALFVLLKEVKIKRRISSAAITRDLQDRITKHLQAGDFVRYAQ